jgi:ubiquinone/menaquinone biosynthesis C-methylase UbiE
MFSITMVVFTVIKDIIYMLRCPACGSSLIAGDDSVVCSLCGAKYRVEDHRIIDFLQRKEGWVSVFERMPELYDIWSRIGWRISGRGSLRGFYEELVYDLVQGYLIDIGCGTGTLLSILESKGYRGIMVGLDISIQMIRAASRKTRRAVFIRSSMDNIPLKDGIIDHYISSLAIHIAEDKQRVFREMSRVLKKEGNIRIAIAVRDSMRGRIFSKLLKIKTLEEREYIKMLETTGIRVTGLKRYGAFTTIYGIKDRL